MTKDREIEAQTRIATVMYCATLIAHQLRPDSTAGQDMKAYLHDMEIYAEMAAELYNKVSWKNGR